MNELERHWIAGILEGEGSFYWQTSNRNYKNPGIRVEMCDLDILERLTTITKIGHITVCNHTKAKRYSSNWSPSWAWQVTRKVDVVALMISIYPLMGERRKAKIHSLIEGVKS